MECVGRLQDHADVLEDVRKDLSVHEATSNDMEGLQIQIEECQVGHVEESNYDLCSPFLLYFTFYVIIYSRIHLFLTNVSFIQSLESELSRLGGVVTADIKKAKQLLNSVNENIPVQIHQDLASTYLQMEPNFTAVSQMCEERRNSLIQAMEVGKVCV